MALGLLLLAPSAFAQDTHGYIGLFHDEEATLCAGDWVSGAYFDVYAVAVITDPGLPGCTVAEFRVDGVPPYAGSAFITLFSYGTPGVDYLILGDPNFFGNGAAINFTAGANGPVIVLFWYNIFILAPTYPGDDVLICVKENLDSGKLQLVGLDFEEYPMDGWCYVANCTPGGEFGNCACDDNIATEDTSWGAVKALY
jgi:hypothetical protein